MYTHCRQFPHFQGSSDDEIRALVRRVLDKHPAYRFGMRARNFGVLATLVGVVLVYRDAPQQVLGVALMLAGTLTTLFVLVWNVLCVNFVLFRLTEQELHCASN